MQGLSKFEDNIKHAFILLVNITLSLGQSEVVKPCFFMIQAVRRDSKSDNQLHLPKIPNLGNERIGSSLIPINEESTMYISSG